MLTYSTLGIIMLVHIYLSHNRQRDTLFMLSVGILGTLVDSMLGWAGILGFHGNWFCPPWLTGLWMVLASTMHYSLSWLNHRLFLGFILGALFGPASYYAGARFGALQLGTDMHTSVLTLSLTWSLILPLLSFLASGRTSLSSNPK